MSMLSSQIDALREASRTYQRMGNRSASNMLKDAADTIWQLRDDLQRTNAENAKLQEQGARLFDKTLELGTENAKLRDELADTPKCEACEAMLDCDECLRADGSHKERRRLSAENSKLRELCSDMFKLAGEVYVPFEDADDWMARDGDIERRMRELGVGVDR